MSLSDQIVTMARWRTRKDAHGEVLRFTTELRLRSLAEPGCLGYEVFTHLDDPGELLLIERYRDDAALQAHRLSSHYREMVVDRILPLLEGRQVELLGVRE